ncbi:adenylate kinase family enzyme [Dyadobacter sp. BE34]|uniref:Adenylate kinase family enzyme n=1 Tax=Dyadobacter fermentans TaxID=94254 RepID=A0ABU1QZI6_9BACT|nr:MULTISPECIES: adenylate kinase [Dyadobacter]MDR6806536.1 adenylate kinase family enzyme [Dyadobacter fermentans]MDR7044277.1 adenylate kinase family enzyme [Dyadobacter sp. BE242]MDR7198588.1 adenylate kinase family enzyme [Dyadobacter sp. BE34]MDR7216550.1 adenylate kinase family enzyme [Dyadobacter sp. BE31]MDR7263924.1 adenylate kinase family enzyme [Dyadobacter sp. BE32]
MKIHIMGASCAGSTTLGNALSERLKIPYFDTDDFFWERSDVPYTLRRDAPTRSRMLREAVSGSDSYIIGGSLISWGDEWLSMFDLVVFLYVPKEVRMQRLVNREIERYGDIIYTDPVRSRLFREFYDWASKYDDRDFTGRNVEVHEDWLRKVKPRVVEIRGDTTVAERVEKLERLLRREVPPQ